MADFRLIAGPAIRRLRRQADLTQAAMAAALDMSPSYLNLLERGQRPLSASVIVKLADRFGFDAASLADAPVAGGVAAMRRRLADPMFADLDLDPRDVEEWLGATPAIAAAFARLYDAGPRETAGAPGDDGEAEPVRLVRRAIERWSNHFPDLDAQAERLADELRLVNPDSYGAIAERLRSKHQIAIRILPTEVMPDRLSRLDLHARQLQLAEMLPAASRSFQAAVLLAQLEAKDEIDALVAGAALADRAAMRMLRRHLRQYFAAALVMPYARFLRACEGSGYDLALLERRFGVGFEQVAHRLTTLQRVGARGLPFLMIRFDRAAQASKRYAGASGSPLVDGAIRCAVWRAHQAFEAPGSAVDDLVLLEDGSRWVTRARTIDTPALDAAGRVVRHAIVLGVEERLAAAWTARGAMPGEPSPIGLGCRRCTRAECGQRAQPPAGRTLSVNDRDRARVPFEFTPG